MNSILNWGLMLGAVALVFSGFKYYNQSKTARAYSAIINEVNNFKTANQMVSAIVADSMEYAKTHPDIKPTLDAVLPKNTATPAAAPKPAAK